ncbi:MAG: phosphonoacetaldehyde hydrolase [Lentisphaerae bacterium]|nr:phosphonoacetaldehyde hydrolase [Lentisphaerota bacterium]
MGTPRNRIPEAVKLVIADLAGTTVDYGSRAPTGAFTTLFARHGVVITPQQVRAPMGLHKRDHIASLCAMPAIAKAWEARHGHRPGEAEIEALFQEFIPLQLESLPAFTDVIPGVPEACQALAARRIPVAVTTGYSRAMMDIVLPAAAAQGFIPAAGFAASDVPDGRPAPWMIFRCMETLGVFPPAAVINVGDTLADVEAGLNAGCWTVGVAGTGNEVGLSRTEFEALRPAHARQLLAKARRSLRRAGAHLVVDGFAEILSVVDAVNRRLARGARP